MVSCGVGTANFNGSPVFNYAFHWDLFSSIFYFLCSIFHIIIYLFDRFHLTIVLSVLRFTAFDYLFDFLKPFLKFLFRRNYNSI